MTILIYLVIASRYTQICEFKIVKKKPAAHYELRAYCQSLRISARINTEDVNGNNNACNGVRAEYILHCSTNSFLLIAYVYSNHTLESITSLQLHNTIDVKINQLSVTFINKSGYSICSHADYVA